MEKKFGEEKALLEIVRNHSELFLEWTVAKNTYIDIKDTKYNTKEEDEGVEFFSFRF